MKYKLVAFDLDGTLVHGELPSWLAVHKHIGVETPQTLDWIKKITSGEATYNDWVYNDINMWIKRGVTKEEIQAAASTLTLIPGAREMLKTLRSKGYKLALISGSIDTMLHHVFPDYKNFFDDVALNRLKFDESGKLVGVTPAGFVYFDKESILQKICDREQLTLKETIFVGDHINDVSAAREAGFSIAFNARSDELKQVSTVVLDSKDAMDLLKHIP